MEETKQDRSVGIDLIKTMAVLFVPCVHFFLNTDYYSTPIANTNMFIQACLRWLFLMAVPLFILCTGYLNYQKTISRSYYLKIFRVIIPYVLISIICLIYRKATGSESLDFQHALFSIFDFSANHYSWYVKMYIGLYLIAPLLNIAVNTLDRKALRIQLIALIIVIALPATLNTLFNSIPKIAYIYFPDWWQKIYPVLYYFIGAYIAKYQVKIKKSYCIILVLIMICLQPCLQIFINRNQVNNWLFSSYSSLFVIAESTGLFLLFYSTNVKNRLIKHTLKWISMLTLEIYLFSDITDSYIYPYFKSHFFGAESPISQEMIFNNYFLMIVPLTFLSSLLMALIFHMFYALCRNGIKFLINKKNS